MVDELITYSSKSYHSSLSGYDLLGIRQAELSCLVASYFLQGLNTHQLDPQNSQTYAYDSHTSSARHERESTPKHRLHLEDRVPKAYQDNSTVFT